MDSVSEIHHKENGEFILFTNSGANVKLGNGNYSERISRLTVLLNRWDTEGKKPSIIDVRYKGEVIVNFAREKL